MLMTADDDPATHLLPRIIHGLFVFMLALDFIRLLDPRLGT